MSSVELCLLLREISPHTALHRSEPKSLITLGPS